MRDVGISESTPRARRVPPCLLMAAGLGSRLDPLTRLRAKAAVPLAGRALIERVIDGLAEQGVSDVVINLHHRPETITALVGDGASRGVRVKYSWEARVLGSAGGPRHALGLLERDVFLIVNGDTLTDVPLEPLLAAHRRTNAAVTLAVIPNPSPRHYNGLEVTEGWVTGARPRGTEAEGTWHFIGIQVVNASVFAALADNEPAETVHGVYRAIMGHGAGHIRAEPVDTPFLDVGTPHDYLRAALGVARGEGRAVAIDAAPGAVAPSARLTDTVVWPGASVGEEAVLSQCIVADVDVPDGWHVSASILVPESAVRAGDRVDVRDGIGIFPLGNA